jgi:hypothetical protein
MNTLYIEYYVGHGRAIAQAVSRWLPATAARVRARVWSSGICGGQSGAGAGFIRVLRFPLPIHSIKFSILTITRNRYNRPRINGPRAEWTQFGLHPPLWKLKKKISRPSHKEKRIAQVFYRSVHQPTSVWDVSFCNRCDIVSSCFFVLLADVFVFTLLEHQHREKRLM